MTWPERLDIILDILAQMPQGWVAVGAMVVVILIGVVIMAAIIAVANEDGHSRDIYYEDYVGSNHGGRW